MRRLLGFLCLVILLSLALAWLADRPGTLELNWFNYQIQTSVFTAGLLLLGAFVVFFIVVQILRAIIHGPEAFKLYWQLRAKKKGLHAAARGLVAVGSWDVRRAQQAADEAEKKLGQTPLTLLLRSQVAQLTGNKEQAEQTFKIMLEDQETRLLGLRGLYVEAERKGDAALAASYAKAASALKGDLPWASTALLITEAKEQRWEEVLSALKLKYKHKLIDKNEERRLRAVALTAQAQTLVETDRTQARGKALEAHQLDQSLVPAAMLAAKLFNEEQDPKKASRILEATWKMLPHPDIAHLYCHLRADENAKERQKRARTLLKSHQQHPEALMALATILAEQREFLEAKETLQPLVSAPTQHVCLLLSKIAEAENDIGTMRAWLDKALIAPRDAVWMADGKVLSTWVPTGPISGMLGACQWQVPQDVPRGAMLLQEQLPNIPEPIALAVEPIVINAVPQVTQGTAPFLPDDPGIIDEEDSATSR